VGIIVDERSPESAEDRFKREWQELLTLYAIASRPGTSSPVMLEVREEARSRLAAKLALHRMPPLADVLLLNDPHEIARALAPRHLLKPKRPLPSSHYGPLVTAETPEDLPDEIERYVDHYARQLGHELDGTFLTSTRITHDGD
jgi:hypothetical protein